jgi:hypothetical protein
MQFFYTDNTPTTRSLDANGNLLLKAKVARIGDQEYLGREIGRQPADKKFTVKRNEDEVFKDSFMDSLKNLPITMMDNGGHPPEFINPTNRSQYPVVGHITDKGQRDGDWVVADCIITDQSAIDAISISDQKLSLGYNADTTDNLEVKNLIGNHLSIVKSPRAGDQCRFQDEVKPPMTIKLKIGDSTIEVVDEANAEKVQSIVDGMLNEVDKKEEEVTKEKAKSAKKDKEIEDLKKSYKDAMDQIESSQKKALGFTDSALSLVDCKRKDLADGSVAGKDWSTASEHEVNAYYDAFFSNKEEAKIQAAGLSDSAPTQVTDARAEYEAIQRRGGI